MTTATNATAQDICNTVRNLPKLPVVHAKDMLHAQAWKPSQEERAAIQARQEFFRAMGLPENVNITVRYVYEPVGVLGHLVFGS